MKDFKPINLIDNLYKLFAKVLVNKLKKVMKQLINQAHKAFLESKKILVTSLITNKIIDSILKKKESGVLCKLDIKMAYDHIN